MACHRRTEDLFLRQESLEQRNAGERQRADHEHDGRLRHRLREARPCAGGRCFCARRGSPRRLPRKSSALKRRVREQVEHARDLAGYAGADRRHHVAELADGRVREHALDVGLHAGEVAARSAVNAPIQATIASTTGVTAKIRPRQQSRPPSPSSLHGSAPRPVSGPPSRRQPDVQRELRRLPDRAEVDAEGDEPEQRRRGSVGCDHRAHLQTSNVPPAPQQHDADQQPTSPALVVEGFPRRRAASGF